MGLTLDRAPRLEAVARAAAGDAKALSQRILAARIAVLDEAHPEEQEAARQRLVGFERDAAAGTPITTTARHALDLEALERAADDHAIGRGNLGACLAAAETVVDTPHYDVGGVPIIDPAPLRVRVAHLHAWLSCVHPNPSAAGAHVAMAEAQLALAHFLRPDLASVPQARVRLLLALGRGGADVPRLVELEPKLALERWVPNTLCRGEAERLAGRLDAAVKLLGGAAALVAQERTTWRAPRDGRAFRECERDVAVALALAELASAPDDATRRACRSRLAAAVARQDAPPLYRWLELEAARVLDAQ
jgi:hypothetical protein